MIRVWPALALLVSLACAGPSQSPGRAEAPPPAPPTPGEPCPEPGDVRVRGECLDPTGERDTSAAWARILAAMPADPPGLGTPVDLPENAILRLEDPDGDGVAVRIDRRVILEGNGAAFRVHGDIVGLRLTQRARSASIRDLTVEGTGRENGGVGIDVRAHGVYLTQVWVRRIHTAVRSETNLDSEETCRVDDDCECDGRCQCHEGHCRNYANVNTQRWTNLFISQCDTGIALRGSDANASLFTGLEIQSTTHAIVDRSFLGNTYVAPTMASATGTSIGLSGSSHYSTVLGGYVEQNSARATAPARSLFVGGNVVRYLDGSGDRIGLRAGQLTFWHPESDLSVVIPGDADSVLTWQHPREHARWQLRLFGEGADARWGFSHRGSPRRTFYFTDSVPELREWRTTHPTPLPRADRRRTSSRPAPTPVDE